MEIFQNRATAPLTYYIYYTTSAEGRSDGWGGLSAVIEHSVPALVILRINKKTFGSVHVCSAEAALKHDTDAIFSHLFQDGGEAACALGTRGPLGSFLTTQSMCSWHKDSLFSEY